MKKAKERNFFQGVASLRVFKERDRDSDPKWKRWERADKRTVERNQIANKSFQSVRLE